ncbi:hypothetical protein MKW98_006387 [Papaver atlanticum]|uniref:Protein FAR1-RELATED SEQUENCE n=1 Tax=Papaver atlanticum TaxID=357466 RepID=A0AAD4X316_9MAGN|nr:hypothetical protein MKW98_006387 [Papaver atlanticum]
MDCALTTKKTDFCIVLSLSGSTRAQILTHLKKDKSEIYSTSTTIYNCMIEDYVWALIILKDLYSPGYLPSLFFTDDGQLLQKGVAEVFPETTNFLCAFHINRNVYADSKTSMIKDNPEDLEKIKGDRYALWMSESYAMYKINLDCVEISWGNMYPKWISYVKNNSWLIKHFDNTMTNHIEGEHVILKRFFKSGYDKCSVNQGVKLNASFEKSKNICLHEHRRSPCIKHLVYHVSRTLLDFISMETKSLSNRDLGHYQHLIPKTHGLPCPCEISKCYRMGKTL